MTFIFNHVGMTMLFIYVNDVRVGRITILVYLIVFSRTLMFFMDMVFIVYIFRRDGFVDLFMRVFLDRRTMISRGLRVVPFLLRFFTIVLGGNLRTI